MKGIICIAIVILILIAGWLWFRPFLKQIWGKYREEFSLKNTEDPVFLFRLLFDIAEYNGNPQLNHNIPYKHSIMSIEERQSFLERITTTGVTFTSRIVQVQTSARLPKDHISELETTGLTTIICDKDHYCLPGANVTVKGIVGLDGYYKNGVSLISYSNEKRDSSDRIDVSYENPIPKGSALGFLHSFLLIKDSSLLPSIDNGIYKGYLTTDLTNSSVEVMHRVYTEMPYNEWLSCVLTTMSYLYGCNPSSYIVGYGTDLYGKVVEDWTTLALNSSYSSRCITKKWK